MKLKEFVRGLVFDGVIVLDVSGGEVVDYLTSPPAHRTLICRNSEGLSARQLSIDEKIISVKTLVDSN